MIVFRIALFVLGAAIVFGTLLSAIRTFVLPRSAVSFLTAMVFRSVRHCFELLLWRTESYYERDSLLALYAPVSLLILPIVWLATVLCGYMCMFYALGVAPWANAFKVSGSSLLTLGFSTVDDLPTTLLAFSEATLGLILVALLIAYLPTMYSAFSKRETAVSMLEVRAGSPPSAAEMIQRFYRLGRLNQFGALWNMWEVWFIELEESHTSLPALNFFRSPHPDRSWVTAAGAVLDTAALINAAIDIPHDPQADLCLRAGYLALRQIADFFGIVYNPNPAPTDPISVTRAEFDAVCDQLHEVGVPMKADRDQAWQHFAGWRVNYDDTLLPLARMTTAPRSPWTGDRPSKRYRPLRRRTI